MISGNKFSNIPGELFSKKIEIAQWFYENSETKLDVYGYILFHQLPNYKGQLMPYPLKFQTLSQYRFSLCFEKIYHPIWSMGYLSEKMLDCLMCGTVPIYLGCYNVAQYVPAKCFINFPNFESYAELNKFLPNISEQCV